MKGLALHGPPPSAALDLGGGEFANDLPDHPGLAASAGRWGPVVQGQGRNRTEAMGILVTERGAIGFSSFGVLLREFSFIPYAVTGHGRGRVCVRVELDVAGEDQPVGHRGRWRCWRRGPDRHPTRPSLAFAAVLVLPIPSMP